MKPKTLQKTLVNLPPFTLHAGAKIVELRFLDGTVCKWTAGDSREWAKLLRMNKVEVLTDLEGANHFCSFQSAEPEASYMAYRFGEDIPSKNPGTRHCKL